MNKKDIEENVKKIKNVKGVKKARGVMNDFKSFAVKGNVIDLATGVIIGTAFTKIVNSIVSEIITPLLSIFTGKMDLNNFFITLGEGHFNTIAEAKAAGVPTLNYGIFLSNVIDFLIVAFVIFIFLRYTFNKKKKEDKVIKETVPTTKECPYCLSSIPIKASKCAFCTSDQPETEKKQDAKDKQKQ